MQNIKNYQLRVILTRTISDELKAALHNESLPQYHCIRDFLQQCVDIYERREANFLREEKDLSSYGGASVLVLITPLQKEYLLSEEAAENFSTPVLQEFLADLRRYSIPKIRF